MITVEGTSDEALASLVAVDVVCPGTVMVVPESVAGTEVAETVIVDEETSDEGEAVDEKIAVDAESVGSVEAVDVAVPDTESGDDANTVAVAETEIDSVDVTDAETESVDDADVTEADTEPVDEAPSVEVAEALSSGSSESLPSSQLPASSSPPSPAPSVALVVSLPAGPPWTPASSNRARASVCVSHERLIPALFTRGRAKQVVPAGHGLTSHFPPTHCAKPPAIHAI